MVAPFEKIYWISLRETLGRRSAMSNYLKEIGIRDLNGNPPEWIEANKGMAIPQQIDTTGRKSQLSKGEIGCYASHYSIYLNMAERGYKTALILEDDARFKDTIPSIFQNWTKMPEWDFVNFCVASFNGTKFEKRIADKELKLFTGYGFWLTHGYAITAQCAEKLIEEMKIQRGGLDWQLAQVQKSLKTFAFDGAPIYQKRIPSARSTIQHTKI